MSISFDLTHLTTRFWLTTNESKSLVGTYLISGTDQTKRVIDEALTAGYRLFDTAHMYNNEKYLGQAFKELLPLHKLTRNDIFITTKFGTEKEFRFLN